MITLSDKFQSDIQTNTYSIVPLIIIDEENNPIYVSTQRQSFSYKRDRITTPPTTGGGSTVIIEGTIFWEDYDLKISNIQESINLDTRQFKTSAVSFSLTNYVIDGERISDVVSRQSLINKYVNIYYKSQSCTSIDDCALVYRGVIKTIKHNSKTIDFKLEDLTENKLEMEIPVSNLGYSKNLYNPKFLGKEIPIHYGYLNRAPSVLWVDNDDTYDGGYAYVITDDVMNPDRNINLGSCAGTDDRFKGFSEGSSQINPLSIFKGDYYTVLKNYSPVAVDNDEDWLWSMPTQYQESGNSLLISKFYHSAIPQNAPANNELQAYIIRRPTHIINSGNSSDDVSLNNIFNISVPIGSPNSAYDDPHYLPVVDNKNYTFDENMYTTFAEIPDSTDECDESRYVTDFSPHYWSPNALSTNAGRDLGCFSPCVHAGLDSDSGGDYMQTLQGDLYTTASFKVFTFLNFHMDKFNGDEDDPTAVYIQLPTVKDMVLRANRKLIEQHYPDFVDGTHYLWDNSMSDEEYPFMIIEKESTINRFEAYPLMCPSALADWLAQSGIDPADDPTGNNFGSGYSPYNAEEEGGETYENASIWRQPFNNEHLQENADYEDIPEMIGSYNPAFVDNQIGAIQYPQPTCVRYMIKQDFTNPSGWIFNSIIDGNADITFIPSDNMEYYLGETEDENWYIGLGHSFLYMSLKNDSMSEAALSTLTGDNPDWGTSIFYNILNTGDGTQFLFDPDTELAQYTPLSISSRFRPHTDTSDTYDEGEGNAGEQFYWNQIINYNCLWNEIPCNSLAGHNDSEQQYGIQYANLPFFSAWGVFKDGVGHVTSYGTGDACDEELKQSEMFKTGNPRSCWAIWIKHPIIGTDEEGIMGGNFNIYNQTTKDNPSLKIPANTLLPCYHLGNDMEWDNIGGWGYTWEEPPHPRKFGTTGSLVPEIDNYVHIVDFPQFDVDETARRVNLVFPLADLEIEDEIKSSTWFTGRILLEIEDNSWSTYSTSFQEDSIQLNVLTAEVAENSLEWDAVFGDDINYTNNLMNINIEEFLQNTEYPQLEYIWSTSNEDTQENLDATDTYNSNPDGVCTRIGIDAWDEANKFNAFALEYKAYESSATGLWSTTAKANIRSEIYHANILQVIVFEKALEANFYVNRGGRVNNVEDYAEELGNGLVKLKYVDVDVDPTEGGIYPLIKEPQDILYHFIEKELLLIDLMDADSLQEARTHYSGIDYGFSINKKITAKKFINDFSKSTCMSPLFKSTSKFGFTLIKNEYSESDFIIKAQDVINYKFTRTAIGKINTIVNVRYNYDYEKDIYLAQTGYVDGYDFFGNGDGTALNPPKENGYSYEYLGVDREDKVLEFESKYIREEATALKLGHFLYAWSCNQHNEFQLNLPNRYAMLEAGDVIEFDSLIDNMKAYGEDYTALSTRNGQTILPYFMINSVSKKPKEIVIKCTQLHNLLKTFNSASGSITRTSDQEGLVTLDDVNLLENFINGGEKYFTREQRRVSDVLNDGFIDEHDLDYLLMIQAGDLAIDGEGNIVSPLGDINLDGVVNILDVVELMQYLMGTGDVPLDEEQLQLADINEDGSIDVVDIVEMMNIIMGNSNGE